MSPRRRKTVLIACIFATTVSSSYGVSSNARAADVRTRPNIVLIIADDQSYRDFGFMGNRLVQTPSIDRLAAESARYPNAYVPMSVCRPSLATMLTGLYPHQHGIHFNHPPPGLDVMRKTMTAREYHSVRSTTDYLIRRAPTLPRILARNGYASLQTGKHWEGDFRTAGFTQGMTLGKPANRLDRVTGTRLQDNGEWVAHGNGDAGLTIGRETMRPIYDFIDKHAGRQPFFVWYAPFLPHIPFDAPKRFRDQYKGHQIPEYLLPYYANITRFDETVGQLLNYLDRNELLPYTMIVFLADNGFKPDRKRKEQHDQRSKLSEFEDGLRTPILIYWRGHVVPAEHQQLVHTIDIVPTLLSAAGLYGELTSQMQGVDLMPSARGEQPLKDRPIFGAIYPNDAQVVGDPAQHVRGRWVREGNLKLLVPGPASNPISRALYDLRTDPREQINLVADPTYTKRVERMERLLDEWWLPSNNSVSKLPAGVANEPNYGQ